MTKKQYIIFLFVTAFALFSLLPLANYTIDQWRVLHHDYAFSYKGISPNKTFLKVAYILDNKNIYDTILMGSSRSGYMDSRLISKNSYNMKFNFALAKQHLENLKTLIKNKVIIKNLWLGVNDYVIWKNPNEHELDFQRKVYKNNFFAQLDTYAFYLLKHLDDRDIKILKGEYQLLPSQELTNPDKVNMQTAKAREDYTKNNPKVWINKMTNISPTLLGYEDKNYRIDEAIQTISAIKTLCDSNDINLTVFMYPSFYKTYLQYNQVKIEEFKEKLVSVVNFHDFYILNDLALNPLNWQDSSHFNASIGTYMIKNIKKNNFLVTKNTIQKHLQFTAKKHINLFEKKKLSKKIEEVYLDMNVSNFVTIFELKQEKHYFKNNQFTLDTNHIGIRLEVHKNDPMIILDPIKSKSKKPVLIYTIESKINTMFQIFYRENNTSDYSEKNSYKVYIKKGLSEYKLLIPVKYLTNQLRIDFVNRVGSYDISLSIKEEVL